MYVSDQKSSNTLAIMALVIGPWLGVFLNAWGWMLDILLLLSVFWIGRNDRQLGFRYAAILLLLGYGLAVFLNGIGSLERIDFIPWAGLVTAWGLKNKWPQSTNVFVSLVAAGIAGVIPVIPILYQSVPQESIQGLVNSVLDQYRQAGMLETFQGQGISETEVINMLESAVNYFVLLTPGLSVISGIALWGAVYYFFARWFPQPGSRIYPLMQWRLPWYSIWGMILAIASYLLGDHFQWVALRGFGINLMLIYSAIALVLGTAVFAYLLRLPWMSRLIKAVIIFTSIVYIQFTVIGLVLLGLFDLVLNIRRLPLGEKRE